ncbi:MAG: S8 family serine peptidase [Cyanobacteria bacterium P01_F01_bin.143]
MNNGLSSQPIRTTGRYLVLLPEGDGSSGGMAALRNSTGASEIDDSVVSNLGVAVVDLDPDQLWSLTAAVAGTQPILAAEPEQIMYAIGGPVVSSDTASYLQGYKDGVTSLVDNFGNGQVTPEQKITTSNFSDTTTATWGLDATNVLGSSFSGQGIKVAVLDTGLDLNHPDFAGRSITSESFIPGETVQDPNGHGTHCIGTACGSLNPPDPANPRRYGVAYNAEIFAGKVLSNSGSGSDGGILNGINWAISNGCQIISMSLGAATRPGDRFSNVYETVAQRALERGTLIIAAAGNESGRPNFVRPVGRPANCPSIIAVAALDRTLQMATFSNSSINPDGGGIDIAGPGVDVYSTWPMPARYQTISGTSMATPHVAGIAALYAEATGKRGLELWALLMRDPQRLALLSTDIGIGLAQAPA